MKSLESFPFMIDEIFDGLEESSRIEIELDPSVLENPAGQSVSSLVKSVNGQRSVQHYLHYMKDIKAETLDKLIEILPQVRPVDTESFFEQVQRRIRRTLQTITIINQYGPERPMIRNVRWNHRHVHFRCNGVVTENSPSCYRSLHQTHRHAWIFYLVVKKLEERTNGFAGVALLMSVTPPLRAEKASHPKFRLSCTVAYLGAMLRVIVDRNIIDKPNIAELIRRIGSAFYTVRQENIGLKSLRNAYDNPNDQILEQVLQELKLWERYIEKFIERKQR
jgi:hypothetical protein